MKNPLQYEQNYLNTTIKPIVEEKKNIKKELKKLEKEYEEGIKEIAKEGKLDEKMAMLSTLNKQMSSRSYNYKKDKLLKRLESQVNNPYFARLDFTFEGDKTHSSFYIGRYAYMPNTKYKIIDWRSPVASLYYNYNEPTKNAKYEFVLQDYGRTLNKKVNGSIDLRRNLEIENSKILAVYDNSLKVNLLATKIKQKSGGVLKDIVETIQHTQNLIIREDPYKVCIIQGTAGSGKTTISIHRISYILYTYKEEINEGNLLLISSSKVLINYITSTLPELEIYALERDTLESYLYKTLLQNKFKTGKNISTSKNEHSIEKNKKRFIEFILEYCKSLEKKLLYQIIQQHFYSELNLNAPMTRMQNLPLFERLETIKDNLEGEYKILKKLYNKGNFTVEDKLFYLEEALSFLRANKTNFEPFNLYTKIVSEYNRAYNTKIMYKIDDLNIDDLSAIYIIASYFYRITFNGKRYKQIVVDEGQDLGLINYYAIKNLLCYEKTGYTVLGDLNQATKDLGNIESWNDLEYVFSKDKLKFYEIEVSYRTTKQIIDLAKSVLQKIPQIQHLPKAFEREGNKPEIKYFTNKKEILNGIISKVIEIRKTNSRAIGIIETNNNEIEETYKYLSKHIQLKRINEKFEDFTGSDIYLVSERLVKGLEFDTVFILDPNANEFKVTKTDAKRLFVCITRAINNLYIYSTTNISKLI